MVAMEKPYAPAVPSPCHPVRDMSTCLFTALSLTILLSLVLEPKAACPDLPTTSPFLPFSTVIVSPSLLFWGPWLQVLPRAYFISDPSGSHTLAAEITWGWWGWGRREGLPRADEYVGCSDGFMLCTRVKTCYTVHLRSMRFTVYQS